MIINNGTMICEEICLIIVSEEPKPLESQLYSYMVSHK